MSLQTAGMLQVVHLARSALIVLFTLAAIAGLAAAEPAAEVWRLDQTARIGGIATEVFGAPRVVTEAGEPAVEFDGAADGLLVTANPLAGRAQFTVEALIRPAAGGLEEQRFLHLQDGPGSRLMLEIRLTDHGWALDTFLRSEQTKSACPLLDRTKLHPVDRWTWVALVYADGRMASYVDGVKELEGKVDFPPLLSGRISLGVRQNKVCWFKGGIREVRFHPVALPPEKLQRVESR